MKLASLLAIPALALAVAACGSSSSSSPSAASNPTAPASTSTSSSSSSTTSAATPATGSLKVTMQNVAFHPAAIHAKVGQSILFVNDDSPPHNVTWVSGPKFTSSPTMNPGAKFTLKLTQAGTIHYYCTIHPFMKGTIVVGS